MAPQNHPLFARLEGDFIAMKLVLFGGGAEGDAGGFAGDVKRDVGLDDSIGEGRCIRESERAAIPIDGPDAFVAA